MAPECLRDNHGVPGAYPLRHLYGMPASRAAAATDVNLPAFLRSQISRALIATTAFAAATSTADTARQKVKLRGPDAAAPEVLNTNSPVR